MHLTRSFRQAYDNAVDQSTVTSTTTETALAFSATILSNAASQPAIIQMQVSLCSQPAPPPPLGFTSRSYATRKTVAQGLLDFALLMANASQLKALLDLPALHRDVFFIPNICLIGVSILLQVVTGEPRRIQANPVYVGPIHPVHAIHQSIHSTPPETYPGFLSEPPRARPLPSTLIQANLSQFHSVQSTLFYCNQSYSFSLSPFNVTPKQFT